MLTLFNVILINTLLKIIWSKNLIVNLTDSNIESIFDQDIKSKWVLFFITDSCPYCRKSYEVLKNEIVPEFAEDNKVRFGLISCTKNLWSAARFNISKIPHIVVIENEKMYEFAGHVTKDALTNFINEEKTIEDALPIPKPYTMLTKFGKGFEVIISEVSNFFENLVERYLSNTKFYFRWKEYYTYIVCLLALVLWFMLEITVLNFIYGRIKAKSVNDKKTKEKTN